MFSSQAAGLGDGRERIRDGLNFDLMSLTESPGAHTGCESKEDDALFDFVDGVKVGVWLTTGSAVGCPGFPVFLSSFRSLWSDAIGVSSPRKQEVTRDVSLVGSRNSFQEFVCGSGKCLLK